MVGTSERFEAKKNVLLTEVGDGQAVLLHLDTRFYYTLNASGIAVWKKLTAASETIGALAEHVSRRFTVDLGEATRDLEDLMKDLLAEGLVTRSD